MSCLFPAVQSPYPNRPLSRHVVVDRISIPNTVPFVDVSSVSKPPIFPELKHDVDNEFEFCSDITATLLTEKFFRSETNTYKLKLVLYASGLLLVYFMDFPLMGLERFGFSLWELKFMVLLPFCAHLVALGTVSIASFLIKRRRSRPVYLRGLYIVYSLKASILCCAMLAVLLLEWNLIILGEIRRFWAHLTSRCLMALCVASIISLLRNLAVKVLGSRYHANLYDRVDKTIFIHTVLDDLGKGRKEPNAARGEVVAVLEYNHEKLSPPWDERLELLSFFTDWMISGDSKKIKKDMSFRRRTTRKMSAARVRKLAKGIFKNVVKQNRDIERSDLLRILDNEVVEKLLPLLKQHIQDGVVKEYAFQNWMLETYEEKKELIRALRGTKRVMRDLNLLTGALAAVASIICTIHVIAVSASSLVLVLIPLLVQNWKTIYFNILFVCTMHPFDIGDHCVIDGEQMIVKDMNFWSTVFFLVKDNTMIQYPNTELVTKIIANYTRAPDIDETIEFFIEVSASKEAIDHLKNSIQAYILTNQDHWLSDHEIVTKEIHLKKKKMELKVKHRNLKDFLEKEILVSELRSELSNILARIEGSTVHRKSKMEKIK